MGLPIAWICHLKAEAKADFSKKVTAALRSDKVIGRLRTLLKLKVETTTTSERDFESAAWPYLRAYKDGRQEALREILELMETNNE